MKIGFDFDKVFVDHPPFVPGKIIEWFYKKKNGKLLYRYPGSLEQKIRILSHHKLLRPPIKHNIDNLSSIVKSSKHDVYLISGRFGFLKDKTGKWLTEYNLNNLFKSLFFNYNNQQPHIYKHQVINDLKIEKYVDDDLDLLSYLAEKNPATTFYWLNNGKKKSKMPFKNIIQIKDLNEFEIKYLNH